MRIKRIKTLSPFRGLPIGFEIIFYLNNTRGIEPICFIGLNGSGKSNVLELIAEIFYYLENYHKADKKRLLLFKNDFGFEIEYYLSKVTFEIAGVRWDELTQYWNQPGKEKEQSIFKFIKRIGEYPVISATIDQQEFVLKNNNNNRNEAILPERVIAYSSGNNELLSNPFIKIDFQYFDELERRARATKDPSLKINRLFFLDYESNKIITICNFLFDAADFDETKLKSDESKATEFGGIYLEPIKKELKIKDLKTFSITLRLSRKPPIGDQDSTDYNVPPELNIAIENLKKCASFYEEKPPKSKSVDLWEIEFYFWVNKATKEAFRYYFKTAYDLYRILYFFGLLNIRLISSKTIKAIKDAKAGTEDNLSDLLPKYEKDRLIFSINDISFIKDNVAEVIHYKKLSDGEHQLLQIFGSLLLMSRPGLIFLFDEPETHFNPEWRSRFVSLLNACIMKEDRSAQEVILSTHSPFIVSDCRKEKVFIFNRESDSSLKSPVNPQINTFGASTSIITEKVFGKQETISELSINEIERIKSLPLNTLEDVKDAKNAARVLGESVEKVMLFRELILREEELKKNAKKL